MYLTAGAIAAFENIFPPFPSDMVIAFAAFLSARAGGPYWAIAIITWIGSVAGALLMYYVGKRYGSLVLLSKLERFAGPKAAIQLERLHAKYGLWALFISRFLPGLRSLVPPFAGAMGLPVGHVTIAIAAASGIWYALVCYLAYMAGEEWESLLRLLARSTKIVTAIALILVLVSVIVWYVRHRRNNRANDANPE